MGVFHVFQIVQMVPNRATHHIFQKYLHRVVLTVKISLQIHYLSCKNIFMKPLCYMRFYRERRQPVVPEINLFIQKYSIV